MPYVGPTPWERYRCSRAMSRDRKARRSRKNPRPPSREGVRPSTFRLPEVSRTARDLAARAETFGPGSAKGTPSKLEGRDMAALVPDVAPLGVPVRVARSSEGKGSDGARRSAAARRVAAFVVERDGERLHGFRSDGARPRVLPGWHRDWAPVLRIDLHGARVRELDERLAAGIRECIRRSGVRLLVIHGKGLHSAGGAGVLAEAVVECLTSGRHARFVRAFATAPERLGGAGALAVELDDRAG